MAEIAGDADALTVSGFTPFVTGAKNFDSVHVDGIGGDDQLSSATQQGVATLVLDGGPGQDVLTGGAGRVTLFGGDGNDVVDGGSGDALVLLGNGNDSLLWNPGDADLTVEGGDGVDTAQVTGADLAERFFLSASGERTKLFRDVGSATLDLDDVERMSMLTLGGADLIDVGDLQGTDLSEIDATTTDNVSDTILLNGTNGRDLIEVTGTASEMAVSGLAGNRLDLTLDANEFDLVQVNALGFDDEMFATLPVGTPQLQLDGGAGDDFLAGGDDDDRLFGGEGNDILDGGLGFDTLDGGLGFDVAFNGEAILNIP